MTIAGKMRAAFLLLCIALACGCAEKKEAVFDATRDKPKICPIHQVTMEKRDAKIVAGVPGPVTELVEFARLAGSVEAFTKEQSTRFPFGRTEVFIGDEFSSERPTRGVVYFCEQCAQSFEKWKAQQEEAIQAPVPTRGNGT